MTRILRGACVAIACAGIGSAVAAGSDELWEVSTQMNMAGMPPGMGAQKTQVCTEKGDQKKAMTRGNDKCKVKDFKQSGNSVHMEMSCPEGDAVLDTTYNAAHTEYKGTMKMTSSRGDMTMTMNGRKIGTCDAQQAKQEREAKVAAVQRQSAEVNAQIAAGQDREIENCKKAVETMNLGLLGVYGQCDRAAGICELQLKNEQTKRAATACTASHAQFCKRYQTMEGFLQANGDEKAAESCKVSRQELIAAQCPQAEKSENLAYLGKFCPAQAKTIAQAHCAGRSYTSQVKDKYSNFCSSYLANASVEQPITPASAVADPKAAIQQGVSQGINKLKGLFGR